MARGNSGISMIHKLAFGWKYSDSKSFSKTFGLLFKEIGRKRVKNAVQKQVIALTDFLEGRTYRKNLNLVYTLFVKNKTRRNFSDELIINNIRQEIWAYRSWLIKRFNLSLPKKDSVPVFIVDDSKVHESRKFSAKTLEEEVASVSENHYLAGIICIEY